MYINCLIPIKVHKSGRSLLDLSDLPHLAELLIPQDFPTRFSRKNFPQDFPARISHKNFMQDFPTRFSCKIFQSWILIGWLPITLFQMVNFHQSLPFLNCPFPLHPFPQEFPTKFSCRIFPQDFPARFSHKNFLQEFPTRFSHQIFPQEFHARFFRKIFQSWILIGWLPITLFQILNFHQSLPFLNLLFSPPPCLARFSHKIFLQEFPSRISCKIFPQEFPARFSRKIFQSWILIGWLPITLFQILNFHQSLPFLNWLFPLHPVPQDFPARFFCKIFPPEFPTRISRKTFLQEFPKLEPDWSAPHHPIPNANFPPITALLNRPTYHKSAKVSPPPFPQILWEPQINE